MNFEYSIAQLRISNARKALANSKSAWAKNYWKNVIVYLERNYANLK